MMKSKRQVMTVGRLVALLVQECSMKDRVMTEDWRDVEEIERLPELRVVRIKRKRVLS